MNSYLFMLIFGICLFILVFYGCFIFFESLFFFNLFSTLFAILLHDFTSRNASLSVSHSFLILSLFLFTYFHFSSSRLIRFVSLNFSLTLFSFRNYFLLYMQSILFFSRPPWFILQPFSSYIFSFYQLFSSTFLSRPLSSSCLFSLRNDSIFLCKLSFFIRPFCFIIRPFSFYLFTFYLLFSSLSISIYISIYLASVFILRLNKFCL